MSKLLAEELSFKQPAIYQISVSGNLDKSWSSRLANMQISLEKNLRKSAPAPLNAAFGGPLWGFNWINLRIKILQIITDEYVR